MTASDAAVWTGILLFIVACVSWFILGGWLADAGFPKYAAYVTGSLAVVSLVAAIWLEVGK